MKQVMKTFTNENIIIPENYQSALGLRETETAIKMTKDFFQTNIAAALKLQRVSAPLMVLSETGLNDHLNGDEKPVTFNVKNIEGKTAEIVQSLAKWKRNALGEYKFEAGEGLYTDMNAIRPDETTGTFHSLYVDQWDWEKIIKKTDRHLEFLKEIAEKIYDSMRKTELEIFEKFPKLPAPVLPENIYFIHSEELEAMYPSLSPKERENEICREKKAVFLIGIGANLKNGKPHDGRASDYDDWITETKNGKRGLNGDILIWYPLLNSAVELSSMGIRVDRQALLKQLTIRNELHKRQLEFHKKLLENKLPLSIGGGIGQSRLCMLFLKKAHLGEVQASIWPDSMKRICQKNNIALL